MLNVTYLLRFVNHLRQYYAVFMDFTADWSSVALGRAHQRALAPLQSRVCLRLFTCRHVRSLLSAIVSQCPVGHSRLWLDYGAVPPGLLEYSYNDSLDPDADWIRKLLPGLEWLCFILALVDCADSHNWAPQQNGSARIAASDRILISTPQDSEYGTHVYNGSGRNTAKNHLQRHQCQITIGANRRRGGKLRGCRLLGSVY